MNESVQYLNGSEGDFLKSLTFAFAMSFHSILEGFALGVQVGVFRLVQKMKLTPAIFLELQSRHPHSLPFSDNPQRNWSLLRWSASEPFQFQTFDVSCYNYFGVRINDPYWFDARRPSNSKFISARSRIDSKTTAKLGNSIKDQQLGHFSSRTRSFTLCVSFCKRVQRAFFPINTCYSPNYDFLHFSHFELNSLKRCNSHDTRFLSSPSQASPLSTCFRQRSSNSMLIGAVFTSKFKFDADCLRHSPN